MSASPEYEPVARQDFGPTTTNENVYEQLLDPKLTDMNIPSVRAPVLRAIALSPNDGDPEPDSTNPENIVHSVQNKQIDSETEYHISEKNIEMPIESLSSIVRIDEGLAFPIIQEAEDSNDANYVENSGATIIQAPINTAIVQNVTKLPQNFTINVDATVGNITTLQNISTQDMSGASQTLWVPTILTTNATNSLETKGIEEDRSQSGVSQIIIASESYDPNQAGSKRGNIVSEASYISRMPKNTKVQILSNISIPKNSYCQQFIAPAGKEAMPAPVYGTQNHVYKLNTNVISQKHLSNSVLCTKPKNQSLIGCPTLSPTVINSNPIRNLSYGHTITKGTNLNKTLNNVNNGANLNAVMAASSGNTQCHILSRVVSGPNKVTVHSGKKSVNTLKGSKTSSASASLPSNPQKGQSRAIKIIQQTGTTHKTESKNWPVTNVATYKSQSTYGVVDTNNSKIIQKVGSPKHKNQHHSMALQKVASKGDRLVLQSPCGPVLISTAPISTSLPKTPHYVQSGSSPNLRFVQTYGTVDTTHCNVSRMTSNQQLTAQILQSLSQPKMMMSSTPNIVNHNITTLPLNEEISEVKPVNQKRIVFGDPSTLLTADDIIGMEERPNLSEDLMRYSFQSLAFVMLDHNYALPAKKQPVAASTASTISTTTPIVSSPILVSTPVSPIKGTSPVNTSTATYEVQPLTVPTNVIGTPIPVTSIQMSALTYKPQPPEDDTASVISSDGERRPGDRDGSDTETAPEGEEEGKTRCICDFTHDDGYMICCDRCSEWQHVDCMGIDRQNIPDAYMCEICQPRPIDRRHARAIQLRKREELSALGGSDTDSSDGNRLPGQRRKRLLTVTTYTNTSGNCVTTYNSGVPALPPLPIPTMAIPKRGPKRPKKTEVVRKTSKRKLSEKRVKRKKELMLNRNKYNSSMSNQSHWQESYELAMTNHYSPELRAKVMKYSNKLGNTANMASAVTAHLCTTVPHAGGKILIATRDLKESTPIIELRGKYMLSNQHKPQLQNSTRVGSQKPGPFVFFYRLPKDNTQICIDTRTYGNEARFVRRSCKPNAELQHCISKGALHVYIVTVGPIQSNTEITVGHDSNGGKQPCACGNPKHCKANGLNPLLTRKTCDYPSREKRMRSRCSSSSSPVSPPMAPTVANKEVASQLPPVKIEKKSPIKQEFAPMSPVKKLIMAFQLDEFSVKEEPPVKEESMEIDLMAKEELKLDIDEPDFCPKESKVDKNESISPPETPSVEPNPEIKEPETVKEEVINEETNKLNTIKADPVQDEPVKEETVEKKEMKEEIKEIKAESDFMLSDEEKPKEAPLEEERVTRNNVVAKSACHDRSSRSSRTTCVNQDSLDDKTDDSQDKIQTPSSKDKDKKKMTREERKMEAIMKAFERMEKAEQRKQEVKERQKRRESDPAQPSIDKDDEDETTSAKKRKNTIPARRKGRARTTSQSTSCNRRRLNSVDSDFVTSGDETNPASTNASLSGTNQRQSFEDREPNDNISEGLGLSSACLLVEAAVGSVESAFKLPKTKKTMATEWIGRSPERTPSPYRSPYRPSLVNTPSLESLVRVASTMIGDLGGGQLAETETDDNRSPPRTPGRDRNKPPKKAKRITRNTPPDVVEVVPSALPQHSAKKRWLRQAISEESDSPTAESPPNEMITPLKKRRLARESLSCDQPTFVPCNEDTSPNMTSEDSPVKNDNMLPITPHCKLRIRNIMDSMYEDRGRRHSEGGHGSDDQCHIDAANDVLNVNLKVAHDSENIRRIIGVPGPEDIQQESTIKRPEDIKTINNNIGENISCDVNVYNTKVVPMEIDNTITPQAKIIESTDAANGEHKDVGSPNDRVNSSQSADTSGNSSPQRDEMDDIQKKIHSFHTENIQILKIRNKKPPKEKRKKVNLNFDLNMVDDQISIQLRTEDETNGDVRDQPSPAINSIGNDAKLHFVSTENIPLPPVESIPLPAPETIPLPEESIPIPCTPLPETIPLPEEPMTSVNVVSQRDVSEKSDTFFLPVDKPSILETTVPFSSKFASTGLFSSIFNNMNPSLAIDNRIDENVLPNAHTIENAIDRSARSEKSIFDRETVPEEDRLLSIQEILTRVNNLDSNNGALLSSALESSERANDRGAAPTSPKTPSKPYRPRSNDPRLNPPPAEKPKPARRKLSISEYRKRLKGGSAAGDADGGATSAATSASADWSAGGGTAGAGSAGDWSSESSGAAAGGAGSAGRAGSRTGDWSSESSGAGSLSPLRLDAAAAAAADDLEQRLHRAFNSVHHPKGVFDAQPTAAERVREKLSSRLRREFGLALPDDEEARPPTHLAEPATTSSGTDR